MHPVTIHCGCPRCTEIVKAASAPGPSLDDLDAPLRELVLAMRDFPGGAAWPEAAIAEALDQWPVRTLIGLVDAIETWVLAGTATELQLRMWEAFAARDADRMFDSGGLLAHHTELHEAWARLRCARDRLTAALS